MNELSKLDTPELWVVVRLGVGSDDTIDRKPDF